MADDYTRYRLKWIDQVWADKSLTPTARDIAMRISQMFNRKSYSNGGIFTAWPSYEFLAAQAGVSSKTVQRAVSLLKDRKHLATRGAGGRHRSLTYYAIIHGGMPTEGGEEEAEKGGQQRPPFEGRSAVDGEKVDTGVPKGGHSCPQKVDTSVLLTSLKKHSDEISDAAECVEASPARSPIGVIVLSLLAAGPTSRPPLPPLLRGRESIFPDLVKDHQAEHGWPDLHERCHDPSLRTVAMAQMALEMEPVSTDSAQWQEWKAEYRQRGWPMPSPLDGFACFPEGGPSELEGFLGRMNALALTGAIDRAANVVRLDGARGARPG